eukprot:scaffold296054_cov24-Tisochrysis_lutea.AAC.2
MAPACGRRGSVAGEAVWMAPACGRRGKCSRCSRGGRHGRVAFAAAYSAWQRVKGMLGFNTKYLIKLSPASKPG